MIVNYYFLLSYLGCKIENFIINFQSLLSQDSSADFLQWALVHRHQIYLPSKTIDWTYDIHCSLYLNEAGLPRSLRMKDGVYTSKYSMSDRSFTDAATWMLQRSEPSINHQLVEDLLPMVDIDLESIMSYERGDASQLTWVWKLIFL